MSAQFALQMAPEVARQGLHWLRALPKAKSRASLPVVAASTVVGLILAQLLLSVAIADGAYKTEHLQAQKVQVQRDLSAVTGDLVRVQSPQYLAKNASALGMISNSNVVYLRLSDGAVLGVPVPADGRTLAGGNVENALLAGVPLVTDVPSTPAGAKPSADATSTRPATGSSQGSQGAPVGAAGSGAAGSVALQGGFPAVHTR
ncbi:MAG TPA: hypothetical protein VK139_02685 [Microbacteriaceae bacterium]|nr:hypothetical protein [Microbacteriaceae bacterium]